jgi:hypothetical protein
MPLPLPPPLRPPAAPPVVPRRFILEHKSRGIVAHSWRGEIVPAVTCRATDASVRIAEP